MNCYDVAVFTSIGSHSALNEDSVEILRNNSQLIAVVADGLGSHGGGDIASSVAIAAIRNSLPKYGITDNAALLSSLETANRAVLAEHYSNVHMKSTAVILAVEGSRASFAHVGDSRGYFFSNGLIKAQTMDHSVSQMAVLRGEITASQIRFHKNRSSLLRALGADEQSHGEITMLDEVQRGDAFLLCTDGFWEYVNEEEMLIDLLKSDTATQWLSYMLTRLGKRISGDYDDISAISILML